MNPESPFRGVWAQVLVSSTDKGLCGEIEENSSDHVFPSIQDLQVAKCDA